MRALYVSFDGLLEPLGYSQVVRVVKGLAGRGADYHILSMERVQDLERTTEVGALRAELAAAGVGWTALDYTTGGTRRAAVGNLLRAGAAVRRLGRDRDLVHARSYLAATLAAGLAPVRRPKLLFDTRGLWFDERRAQGRWFANDWVFGGAKRLERTLYGRADAVVTLTELSAEDVRAGRMGPLRAAAPVMAIPTAVDFEAFDVAHRAEAKAFLRDRWPEVGAGPVLGFVGSVNSWYKVDEALQLFAGVLARRPDARLVTLSAAHDEIRRRLEALGVPSAAILCTRAEHRDMPRWVAALDWGFLLLGASEAKRASMPTKLGEFFAAGVRPIHYGCNDEVGEWVARTGSGFSLPGLATQDLEAAADAIAAATRPEAERSEARSRAETHFSLSSAVDRYADILDRLG